MVMKWLNNNKDIKLMFVLFIVFLVGMTSYTIGRTQDNAPMMYEDEMIYLLMTSLHCSNQLLLYKKV